MTTATGDDVIHMVSGKLTEVQEMMQKLYDGVNQLLSWVPEAFMHLIEPIKKGMEEIVKLHKQMFDQIMQTVERAGSPGLLRAASQQWADLVAEKLGTVAGDLKLDKHRTNIEWEGRAAEAYKALVPGQADAVNGTKSAADKMVTALDTLANAVEMFWISIGIAVVTFLGGLATAIAGCIGVVTAPPGLAFGVSVGVAAIGLATAAFSAFIGAIQPINSQMKSAQKTIDELGGKWATPENGVDLSDGSSSDGDESNWEAR
ncbi:MULTISPECIES: WXG100 family type VII secretion target [unclassified Saccharopolyspora]|uniref:WXG100 family type VII secretion target n=1 Tax=unclassified Saccharopolyspora TaxID=2646250 RepID=UPI001CD1A6C8|nr:MULTISPECIES: hypothetical protein [unclassified Saccharopolyspora]MCA1189405.1 hypothetical protein [Saccharopolyspora sp. 6T]MCA1191244.1 hypothetical protein [Saccharopolyspora sp. 6V]MCA1228692.1 hypothetical protein [Saccharopolyspora sp. 6M]